MSKLKVFFKNLGFLAKKHSPRVLGGLALGGLVTTCVFTAKEAPIAKERMNDLRARHREAYENGESDTDKVPVKEVIKEVVPVYIPAIGMGLVTGGCIVGSVVAGEKQKAILSGAAASAEMALSEYQKKVKELYGESSELAVRDELSQEYVRNNPPVEDDIYDTGHGHTLCYEPLTARYFWCDADTIKKGEIEMNRKLLREMWVPANELFMEWGLEPCGLGEDRGWNPDHQVELHFTSMLAKDDLPCLVIGYVNRPVVAY